jgi:hypothetical protein
LKAVLVTMPVLALGMGCGTCSLRLKRLADFTWQSMVFFLVLESILFLAVN